LNVGSVSVYAALGADSVAEVVEIVRNEMISLRENGLTDEELVRAKSQIKGHILLNLESCSSRMRRLAVNEIHYGRVVPIDEIAARIDEVHATAVRELAGEFFGSQDLLVSLLGRLENNAVPDAALRLI
jgi:predicted Zn-dependent peptidase